MMLIDAVTKSAALPRQLLPRLQCAEIAGKCVTTFRLGDVDL